jgi:hypothetical protein
MVDRNQSPINHGEILPWNDSEQAIDKTIESALQWVAKEDVSNGIDLWPGILAQIKHRTPRNNRLRRRYKTLITLASAVILMAVLLWVSPTLRAGVAHAIESIGQFIGVEISVEGDRVVQFGPPPPFVVKQPGYLPKGYELVSEEYHPEQADLPAIKEERVNPRSSTTSQGTLPVLNQDQLTGAYLILRYEADSRQYLQLTERSNTTG